MRTDRYQNKFNSAIEAHQSGSIVKAITLYIDLLETDQLNPQLLFLIGSAHLQLEQFEEAITFLHQSINLYPTNPISYYNLGLSFQSLQRFDEAIYNYQIAIQMQPDYVEAYNNLGVSLSKLKRFNEALKNYQQALLLQPQDAEIYCNRGVIFKELKMFDDALLDFKKSIELRPNYADAYLNQGMLFEAIGLTDKSVSNYKKAIELKPDYADAYSNLGTIFHDLGEYSEALECYEKVIELKGDCINAYWNKSLLMLLNGDYEEGWNLYEWRWRRDKNEARRHINKPIWLGINSIKDKKVLVWSEQGLGDCIQFCRYVFLMQSLGAKIILEVPFQLKIILSTLDKNITIIEKGQPLPDFDLQVPMMSLPLAFKTAVDTIPAKAPYLFSNDKFNKRWKKFLGNTNKFRVGLAWSGSENHTKDKKRSIPLKIIEKLLCLPLEFHSLQINYKESDFEILKLNPKIFQHQKNIKDFSDTAALINNLDLVISVDTSVAHLAGALGKPIWILLSYSPDFRWMLNRKNSPWYSSAQLFRQSRVDDWETVIDEVWVELKKLTSSNT